MAVYHYQAVDVAGKLKTGTLSADSAKAARAQLRDLALSPVQVLLASNESADPKKRELSFFKRISQRELSLITRQLASLLSAHIALLDALNALVSQATEGRLKQVLLSVRNSVREGYAFSQALAKHPHAFPPLYVASVEAGESTGRLSVILLELADYLERQQAIQLKLQQALAYPSIVTVIALAIITFLLVYVVPNMVQVYDTLHQELPFMTISLIAISTFLKESGWIMLLIGVILLLFVRQSLKKKALKAGVDTVLLRLPLVSRLIRLVNLARFTRTLGMLIAAGVPLIEALTIATKLVSNTHLRAALVQASLRVREGKSLSQSLKETGVFLPMTLHFIASGEASGELPDLLSRAALSEEQAVNRYIDFGLTLFEPLMILIMGGMVLFIVLAILLPIFSMEQMVSLS